MEDRLQHTSAIPRVFTFDFLEHITNKFSKDQIVGRGGYGVVYKGVLDNGEEIVVKKLYNTYPGDNDKFKNECTNLMRLQHDNIVCLVGYCYEIAHESVNHKGKYVLAEVEKKALCFEYLHGGSLDKHLSDEFCGLGWHTRYKIIKGICKGLYYLHKGFEDPIYHLDLKPANILLDKNMVPKIGDFGLSRLFDSTTTCTTKAIIGTAGYMPPEYINRYQITSKTDAFSLGVIIIQVMTGREGYLKFGNMPSQDFIELVNENWGKRYQATMSSVTSFEIKTCLKIALRCLEVDQVKRPTITDIVDELDKLDTEKRSLMDQVDVQQRPPNLPEDHISYQQQPFSYGMQPPQVPVNGPQGIDARAYKDSNHPAAEPLREYARDLPHDYTRAIDARMQAVHLGPSAPPESSVQGKTSISHGVIDHVKPPVNIDGSSSIYKSQAGGYHMGITNAFTAPALTQEDNIARHSEQPPYAFDVGAQNVHPDIIQRPPSLQPVSNEKFTVQPLNSGAQVPAGPPLQHPKEMPNHLVSAPPNGSSKFPLQTTVGIDPVEATQEPAYTDSLFSNQDPWKAVGNASLVPPRPSKLTKEPVVSGGQYTDGHMPDMNTHASEPLEDPSFKDIHPVKLNKGFGEDNVKRQLQAVAEGVAASVLQPPFHEKPAAFSGDHIDSHEVVLQIIENSDLEELRELGSGTFGTVYHGKWRGSDVAIKRINDRCFAGKASEQERMRTDFWNEVCKLASLHHPNVVAFYGVVLDGPGGSVATVTEYMANGSLRQALQRHEKIFDRRRRLLIAMDVAFGMEYLHVKNIVHFDLKSDNLLVNLRDPQQPICKVGDLGSKVKCQTLISGGVRGTLPWMAPELLNGSSSLLSEKQWRIQGGCWGGCSTPR